MARGDVVIGVADGYPPNVIEPWLASLKASGFDGQALLLASEIDPDVSALAASYGARTIRFSELLASSPTTQRWANQLVRRRFGRHLYALQAVMWLPRLMDRIATLWCGRDVYGARLLAVANLYPVALARYAFYLAAVIGLQAEGARFALADVRDVLFQTDPFGASLDGPVSVFAEREGIGLGDCPYNREWLIAGYGRRLAEQLAGCAILCSGVTIGSGPQIQRYLQDMLVELEHLRFPRIGTDQACHNVLVYRDASAFSIAGNDDGVVFTMGRADSGDIRWDADGYLVSQGGRRYRILHQYDRFLASGEIARGPDPARLVAGTTPHVGGHRLDGASRPE